MPLPPRGEQLIGGHAVLAVGYDDKIQRFIVRNSWGTGWGIKGYYTMPYGYLTDPGLARDFWAIHAVEPDTTTRRRTTRKKTTTMRKRTTSAKR